MRVRASASILRGPVLARVALAAAIAAPVFAATDARADDPIAAPPDRTPTPFDRLGWDTLDAFSGTNLFFHAGAFAATGVMAFGGADQAIRLFAQRDIPSRAYGDASYYAGYILPLLVAPGIYVIGLVAPNRTVAGAGAAATQALAVTILTTGFLKWATGRPFPNHGGDPRDPDRLTHDEYAREFAFQPFVLDRGYAWPSGHTSSTITIAAALTAYYPETWWVPAIGYPIALGIGCGMIVGDHHWASDVVAGALMGHAIGYSIGRNFRRMYREGERPASARAPSITILPLAGATYGLAVGGAF
jgi:membrane-associated phospholipid phosphatase